MKFDFSKNKKITMIEVCVFVILITACIIYFSPLFIHKQEAMMAAKLKADSAVFTSKVLEEFSTDTKIKSSDVAQKVSEELNTKNKNPYNKKEKAYTFETDCKGCNSVEYNDDLSMVILTTYDKKGDLVARTVIKPPSFVTYTKDDED